jgi:hypothetical protein
VRTQLLEDLLAHLERRCLHGGPGALDDVGKTAVEVQAFLRQLGEHANELQTILGCARTAAPLPERRVAPREPNGMRGSTEVLSVGDLVGLLSSHKKTGTLTLHGGDVMFVFEFQTGAIVHAVTNSLGPEMRLGMILVAQNKLTETQLLAHVEASQQANELLGTQLVRSETVSAPDLREALKLQVRSIFEAAFELRDARFTFVEGNVSNIAQRVRLNTTHLLLEAARQCDERQRALGHGAPATKSALDTILPG